MFNFNMKFNEDLKMLLTGRQIKDIESLCLGVKESFNKERFIFIEDNGFLVQLSNNYKLFGKKGTFNIPIIVISQVDGELSLRFSENMPLLREEIIEDLYRIYSEYFSEDFLLEKDVS